MTSDQTTLRYLTDGILVRECLQDMDLKQYDVVILDEAHERSLYTDVLFALVKMAAENRKGSLKVLVTSATLNVSLFKSYFNECQVIKVHGKSFPVEVKFSEQPVNNTKRN
jgi:ATP-dependent RNA helicase DHX8/PRP22